MHLSKASFSYASLALRGLHATYSTAVGWIMPFSGQEVKGFKSSAIYPPTTLGILCQCHSQHGPVLVLLRSCHGCTNLPFLPQQTHGLVPATKVAPPPQTATAHPTIFPTLPQLAPFSGSIPSILAKYATTATAGEFIDFNELLHTLELEDTEETPLQIELGDDSKLTLPRKPKWK